MTAAKMTADERVEVEIMDIFASSGRLLLFHHIL
jgi:hypothetical protein